MEIPVRPGLRDIELLTRVVRAVAYGEYDTDAHPLRLQGRDDVSGTHAPVAADEDDW
ncbi:MAG: hypothetical protein M3309_14135 [Actinomycetota bacterium]|nr:hypothetical protein [Actinomycetota bacterium]